jgi:hypothetical protein
MGFPEKTLASVPQRVWQTLVFCRATFLKESAGANRRLANHAKPSWRRPSSDNISGVQRGSQTRVISPPVNPGISWRAAPTPSPSTSCIGQPGVVRVMARLTKPASVVSGRHRSYSILFSRSCYSCLWLLVRAPPCGRITAKVLPSPGVLSTQSIPRCCATMALPSTNPRPRPLTSRVRR